MHEPFAPSTSNAALRHSRSLNVGSFHAPTERLLSTLVARRFVESFFGRLDARTASLPATAELMARHFPGEYRLLGDGADPEVAADELEQIYRGLAARRHPTGGDPALRRRLAKRPLIDVDLHMHTDHSHDCATPVEVLLATAREQGLGAIAVTDHNEISGALEARRQAANRAPPTPPAPPGRASVKVIVGEEVKTADQGEVIGLFIEEKIPRGLTLQETVAEIKRQGGLVYVPHPFDRMHSVPDYEHLLTILDDVDAIEVFNPRVAIGAFNEEAVRFAAKYRIVAGAGLGLARRPGPRLGAHPDARLRRAGRVPAVAARRRHPHAPDQPAVRAGAEVPADEGHARLRPARAQGPARQAREADPMKAQVLMHAQGQVERVVKSLGVDARDR